MSNEATPGAITDGHSAAGAIAGVYRVGDHLIAPCGADLSRFCICCGKPATGKPMVRAFGTGETWSPGTRGAGSANPIMGLLFAILFLGSFASAAAREKEEMTKQRITIGLCDLHARRRGRLGRFALLTLLAGVVVFIAGLWTQIAESHSEVGVTTDFPVMAMIGGPLIGTIMAVLIASRMIRLRLVAVVDDGMLCLDGAGEAFLAAQTPLPRSA